MTNLGGMCTDVGYRDTMTSLALDNVVLTTDDGAADVKAAPAPTGLVTNVFIRGSAELEPVINAHPYIDADEHHPSQVTVIFYRYSLRLRRSAACAQSMTGRNGFARPGGS